MAKPTLADLPPEIISQIASHAPSAQFLRNLSLTSRSLHRVIEADGWSSFVVNRFPSISVPPYWRDAAHALTTLSKNWDRRAFFAVDVGPDFGPNYTLIHEQPSGQVSTKWRRPQGQTMGYHPVIDSYEEWTGGSWDSRRETVAWGAGSELVVKTLERGEAVRKSYARLSAEERDRHFGRVYDRSGGSRHTYIAYREPEHAEGRDDITSLNLLSPHTSGAASDIRAVVGRASGGLQTLSISSKSSEVTTDYNTRGLSVRSADVNTATNPLLASCLGDSSVALYKVNGEENYREPHSEVRCVSPGESGCRTWSTKFLGEDKLAIGRGISNQIVSVYGVRSDGLSEHPIRSFKSLSRDMEPKSTSAYPTVGMPGSHGCSDAAGDVFFSGGYDGLVRLHDMRSPSDCEAALMDPVDDSAIFSLTTVGRERLIAGASNHNLLKVYDLRMAGGRVYFHQDVAGAVPIEGRRVPRYTPRSSVCPMAWNVFVAHPTLRGSIRDQRQGFRRQGPPQSPVYSLSRPSPSSPSLYVGLENQVVHFNFTATGDEHPDPVFRGSLVRKKEGPIDQQMTWYPTYRAITLAMYEQTQGEVHLKRQRSATENENDKHGRYIPIPGFDERWYERWQVERRA